MRISEQEHHAIVDVLKRHFGQEAKVGLKSRNNRPKGVVRSSFHGWAFTSKLLRKGKMQ